jgi:hypothetical protein
MLLSCNLGTLTSWNPLGHSRPVTGLLYLFSFYTDTLHKILRQNYFWIEQLRMLAAILVSCRVHPNSPTSFSLFAFRYTIRLSEPFVWNFSQFHRVENITGKQTFMTVKHGKKNNSKFLWRAVSVIEKCCCEVRDQLEETVAYTRLW